VILVALVVSGLVAIAIATGLNTGSVWRDMVQEVKSLFPYALGIQLGIIALLSVLEWVLPAAGPRKPLKRYILNLEVVLFGHLSGPIIGALSGAAAVAVLGKKVGLGWIDLRFTTGHGAWVLIPAFLLSTLIFDFFYYWFHRFEHETPILWQVHKLHHMDEELCTLNRDNPFEGLFQGPATAIPIAILFNLDPLQGAIIGYAGFVWIQFIHMNIKFPLGPLGMLFNGPQVHRIHHSRLHAHFDQNYAAFFPIWDVLFGTYFHPRRDEYPPTGVHDEREVQNFVAAVLLPWRAWWNMLRKWRLGLDAPALP
jgi:sterol desaturase/sphingolipid hydroxylase (fatty acid hydroxylase superfamily)